MKNFERYIYIGDIHGSYKFSDFIKEYNDGKTFFYFLGDLFDRGNFSYENYLIIKKLHEEGKINGVLGNHDLFFILGYGIENLGLENSDIDYIIREKNIEITKYKELGRIFHKQYIYNGGIETNDSIRGDTNDEDLYNKRKLEMVNFFFNNFDLYLIDHNNNLLLHGGVPMLKDGTIIHEDIGGKLLGGIERIKEINRLYKEMDYNTLKKLTAIDDNFSQHSISLMERFGLLKSNVDFYNGLYYEYGRFYLPTWMDNEIYENEEIKEILQKELKKHGLNKIFVGHWWNMTLDSDFRNINSKYWEQNKDFLFRLDRSNNYGNLGYAIFNKDNNVIKINDY